MKKLEDERLQAQFVTAGLPAILLVIGVFVVQAGASIANAKSSYFPFPQRRDFSTPPRTLKVRQFQLTQKHRQPQLNKVIIDGNKVTAGSHPSHFAVLVKAEDLTRSEGRTICTGVVMARDLVMTAGHCLPRKGLQVTVHFGLGGKHGFYASRNAVSYRNLFEHKKKKIKKLIAEGSPSGKQDFGYNQKSHQEFLASSEAKKNWTDYSSIYVPKLLGIIASGKNGCGNDGFFIDPRYFKHEIDEARREMSPEVLEAI